MKVYRYKQSLFTENSYYIAINNTMKGFYIFFMYYRKIVLVKKGFIINTNNHKEKRIIEADYIFF